MTLELVDASPVGTWRSTDSSFVIPPAFKKFKADLAVLLDGQYLSTLHVSCHDPTYGFDVACKRQLVHTQGWTMFPLGREQYDCSIARASGGFVVARAYSRKRVPDHLDILLLEVEGAQLGRLLWLVLYQLF